MNSLQRAAPFEIWIEEQTETYWVKYSACRSKFSAGLILRDISAPAIAYPLTLQKIAEVLLRNTDIGAHGTFNHQQAKVIHSALHGKTLSTVFIEYSYDSRGLIRSNFIKK